MPRHPNPSPALGTFRLGDLPEELVLAIAYAAPIRDRCMLHQTCKHLHSLLADSVTEKRRLTAQVLPRKQEHEEHDWEWSSPNAIAGIDMPIWSLWGYDFRFSKEPHGNEIFARAIKRGDIDTVTKYLHSGVDPNIYSLTGGFMLHVGVAANQPGMYRNAPYDDFMYWTDLALLRAFSGSGGAKVAGFAYYIARCASWQVMQVCMDAGMDLNQAASNGDTVAHALAGRNDCQFFGKVAPHLTNETMTKVSIRGETPLHAALKQTTPDIAREFIEAGTDPKSLDKSIDSALLTALQNRHFELVRLRLSRNAELALERYIGGREILAAISAWEVDIVRMLIRRSVRNILRCLCAPFGWKLGDREVGLRGRTETEASHGRGRI